MDLQDNRCTPNMLPKYMALDGTLENIAPKGGTGRNTPVDASVAFLENGNVYGIFIGIYELRSVFFFMRHVAFSGKTYLL